jgi:hypothetical protein
MAKLGAWSRPYSPGRQQIRVGFALLILKGVKIFTAVVLGFYRQQIFLGDISPSGFRANICMGAALVIEPQK